MTTINQLTFGQVVISDQGEYGVVSDYNGAEYYALIDINDLDFSQDEIENAVLVSDFYDEE